MAGFEEMDDEFDFSGSFKVKNTVDEEETIDYAEVERLESSVADPTTIRERIDNALEILANFSNRRDKTRSRIDILQPLSK